ncbi:MAG: metal ABC transporter substrate-binding protein [bacterium]|nr:metal ABC transporter substrate-binding protein [bacterium]
MPHGYHCIRAGLLALGACVLAWGAAPAAPATNAAPLRIVTSFYPLYITTLNIVAGVPGVSLKNLTRPTTGCLHDYQLTPAELRALADADVFIVNGAGLESFLTKVMAHTTNLTVVTASQGLDLLRDEHGVNPHVWVSIRGVIGQARVIATALAVRDPRNAPEYQRNCAAYVAQLAALRTEMQAGLSGATTRTIITFHEAFPYFAREFGLRVAAVVEREPADCSGDRARTGQRAESARLGRDHPVGTQNGRHRAVCRAAILGARRGRDRARVRRNRLSARPGRDGSPDQRRVSHDYAPEFGHVAAGPECRPATSINTPRGLSVEMMNDE